MDDRSRVTTILFTDIEGSTRLWEREPSRMPEALARHDAVGRQAVEAHRGVVVKTTGDGLHAAFDDPCDALAAALAIQRGLADPAATAGLALPVRAGVHAGVVERRDRDFFGATVNRAARIMAIAHGGQTLVSQAVADLVRGRMPPQSALRDLGSVRLRDLSGSERVYQLDHPALRSDFPALRSLESTPNNLPQQLTTFVGRERELAEVRALLRTTRLLTLCGTGGLGKTRLALQAAAAALPAYPDGVWFVDLAPLTDAALVPEAIASALGVRDDAGRSAAEALRDFVRDRSMLLVLDNCEHVVEACARVAVALLQEASGLHLVATTREALRVGGERTYLVPALSVPDGVDDDDPDAVGRHASIRLFVDRASAAQPSFRLTSRNAAQVAGICRRLDGLPLAIELAAARLRSLPLETIAAKLDDALRLLASGGDRTVQPRQQTLRALVDWSHDMLAPAEKALFRRLSACPGGWTVGTAEAVGAGGEVSADDVPALLGSLVDKSLVAFDAQEGRYRQLDTIRQYAAQRLRASGEEAAVRLRALEHVLALAESTRAALASAAGAAAFARLDAEHENLLAAHATSAEPQVPPELGCRLVHALKPYWANRSLDLGRRLAIDAAARADGQPPTVVVAYALFDAGQLSAYTGRYAEAPPFLDRCLAIALPAGELALAAAALQFLALAALGQGDRSGARRHCTEALDLARRVGSRLEIAGACTALGQLLRLDGSTDDAAPLLHEALDLSRREGNAEYLTTALLNLAMAEVERGDDEAARRCLAEGLATAREAGSRHLMLTALDAAAGLAALRADWERAARLYGVAEAQADALGIRRDPVDESFVRRSVDAIGEALGAEGLARGERAGRVESLEDAVESTAGWLAAGA